MTFQWGIQVSYYVKNLGIMRARLLTLLKAELGTPTALLGHYVEPRLRAMVLNQFSDEDLVVVRLFGADPAGGDILVASCYMPGEETDAIEFAEANGLPMVLGFDAKAHHVVWGSKDINPRGAVLLQYVARTDLESPKQR